MNATQTRRTLALRPCRFAYCSLPGANCPATFDRHPLSKLALRWWTLAVYNWCRTNRMLKQPRC